MSKKFILKNPEMISQIPNDVRELHINYTASNNDIFKCLINYPHIEEIQFTPSVYVRISKGTKNLLDLKNIKIEIGQIRGKYSKEIKEFAIGYDGSCRKISSLILERYGVTVSHQTIINWKWKSLTSK